MTIERVTDLVEEVRADLTEGFVEIFEEVGGFSVLSPFEDVLVQSGAVSVLAWAWNVRHVGPIPRTLPDQPPPPEDILTVPVQFIPATERVLTINGVTVVDERSDSPTFHRFIDWFGLYGALGAITMARPPVDERRRP